MKLINKVTQAQARLHAKKDFYLVTLEPSVTDAMVHEETPASDNALRQYILDSIAWLDEGAE
jgi:hypothetical protein